VNPDHLVVVRDAAEHWEHEHALTKACGKGHPYPENLRFVKSGKNVGMRYCAECNRQNYHNRKRAA
jgi:hypothetical protein